MQVTIGLSRAHYEKLLHDVPPEAPAYDILHRFPQLDRWADEKPFSMCVIIECENSDAAIALLKTAREHCPGAIPDIMYALKMSGVLDLIS
jgi:hypothetical protein